MSSAHAPPTGRPAVRQSKSNPHPSHFLHNAVLVRCSASSVALDRAKDSASTRRDLPNDQKKKPDSHQGTGSRSTYVPYDDDDDDDDVQLAAVKVKVGGTSMSGFYPWMQYILEAAQPDGPTGSSQNSTPPSIRRPASIH